MTTIHDFRQYQIGKEATPGTLVPATSKLLVPRIDFVSTGRVSRPQLAKGLIIDNPGNEAVTSRGVDFTVPDHPLFYEVAHKWASLGIKGGVTPAVGVWTFTRDPLTDPALDSATLEERHTDGSTPTDREYGYATLRSLKWTGQADEEWMTSYAGFARRAQSSTFTPALAFPTVNMALFNSSKLFIDATFAGLGGTQVSNQFLSASIEFKTGAEPQATADGRSDLDFSLRQYISANTGLVVSITCLANATTIAAEKAAAEAQTLRAVRVQVDDTVARQIQWDMLLKHSEESVLTWGEDNGRETVTFNFVSATDGTNFFRYKVTNGVTSWT